MGPNGTVLDAASSADGMATLAPSEFEVALGKLVTPWLPTERERNIPVIACGMVGARGGWIEAAYIEIPACPPDGVVATEAPVNTLPVSMHILPGMCQREPADVMRGEETQLAGLLAHTPDYDGIVCLPGTHTKWVRVADGKILNFKTFMTGELFALLSEKSVLRLSMDSDALCMTSFDEGVALALDQPERVMAELFSLRAASLLDDLPAHSAKGRLSGLLIGLEIAATRELRSRHRITIVGAEALSGLYERAITTQGNCGDRVNSDDLVIAGLNAAYVRFLGSYS